MSIHIEVFDDRNKEGSSLPMFLQLVFVLHTGDNVIDIHIGFGRVKRGNPVLFAGDDSSTW